MSARPMFGVAPIRSTFAGDAAMAELLAIFLRDLRDRQRRLAEAWAISDHEQVLAIAHQLRGVGGGYGYPALSEAADTIEQARRSGTPLDSAYTGLQTVIGNVLAGDTTAAERAA